MNAAHFHLIINHFPLIGFVFAFFFLTVFVLRRTNGFLNAGLMLLVISGALAIPTYLSGEPAEEVLENRPGFAEERVEEHEDAALFALIFTLVTGASAALTARMVCKNHPHREMMIRLTLALTLFTLTVLGRTSLLGGRISHPEILGSEEAASPPSESDNK